MQHHIRAQRVMLTEIDFPNFTYSLSPIHNDEINVGLATSIKKTGILHPPIIIERSSNRFQIITGRQRLLIAQNIINKDEVLCLVLGQKTSEKECLHIAYEDLRTTREPSPIERALFFKKMSNHYELQKIAETYLQDLGKKASGAAIKKYLRLLEFEAPIIHSVHEYIIDERVALELIGFTMRDRLAIFEIINELRLSVSNQKKILASAKELAKRNDCSILTILGSKEIQNILNHSTANTPQKTAMLMSWLSEQRFPRLYSAEKEFREFRKSLKLPAFCALEHSPSFEKNTITLSITFKDKDSLNSKWPDLNKLLDFNKK